MKTIVFENAPLFVDLSCPTRPVDSELLDGKDLPVDLAMHDPEQVSRFDVLQKQEISLSEDYHSFISQLGLPPSVPLSSVKCLGRLLAPRTRPMSSFDEDGEPQMVKDPEVEPAQITRALCCRSLGVLLNAEALGLDLRPRRQPKVEDGDQ